MNYSIDATVQDYNYTCGPNSTYQPLVWFYGSRTPAIVTDPSHYAPALPGDQAAISVDGQGNCSIANLTGEDTGSWAVARCPFCGAPLRTDSAFGGVGICDYLGCPGHMAAYMRSLLHHLHLGDLPDTIYRLLLASGRLTTLCDLWRIDLQMDDFARFDRVNPEDLREFINRVHGVRGHVTVGAIVRALCFRMNACTEWLSDQSQFTVQAVQRMLADPSCPPALRYEPNKVVLLQLASYLER